ncbi:helix-turn-helix transcriptional regulator [Phytohabitans sp. ZYX-F-186]|uniref:Helix-turn-helix transcriptional regulator n=1 Tax=Phytohabitans maris TaxID=3071409 RepID=A0ABU0Z7Z5_9ACTN|nr:helix-turn-helix transcriptional regulator [Phytohabitans sp. ZYX-F-186]MDQ7903181.1 helix-turn-helix transcriptional regulator [Phytohabitans sp. ZYX-F-186]
MKLSDLKTVDQLIEERREKDAEFREIWDSTAFARQVAIIVVRYRTERGLSQRELARLTGLQQPAIARLENGETEPRLQTLAKLTAATGLSFHLDVVRGGVELVPA